MIVQSPIWQFLPMVTKSPTLTRLPNFALQAMRERSERRRRYFFFWSAMYLSSSARAL